MHGNPLPVTERWLFEVTSLTSSQVDTSSISEDLPISNSAPFESKAVGHFQLGKLSWHGLL